MVLSLQEGLSENSTYHLMYVCMYVFLIESREKGSEKERERNTDVSEKHQLVASCMRPAWGRNVQPRHVPWPGIKPVTCQFVGHTQSPEPQQPGQHLPYFYHLLCAIYCIKCFTYFISFNHHNVVLLALFLLFYRRTSKGMKRLGWSYIA